MQRDGSLNVRGLGKGVPCSSENYCVLDCYRDEFGET